ncbi:MAG: LUD domain-containing protein [Micropruina sp.]|uniref:LUD domain-containing protein n=1 Tax=Micropruina sp. TaxID=2737536 RepID=UPI0039E2C6A9
MFRSTPVSRGPSCAELWRRRPTLADDFALLCTHSPGSNHGNDAETRRSENPLAGATIVLDHRPDQGRRALSLVPTLQVCVIRADQVVADVPEAVARLRSSQHRSSAADLLVLPAPSSSRPPRPPGPLVLPAPSSSRRMPGSLVGCGRRGEIPDRVWIESGMRG